MILSKKDILKEIKKNKIKITPFNEKNIHGASIDLTLDNKFRKFKRSIRKIEVSETVDYKDYTNLIEVEDYLILKPNETVLGITKEKIKLPDNVCGWLQGRSRFARLGLLVHISSNFIQPGVDNKQVLEMKNVGKITLKIKPGLKICQLILEKVSSNAEYKGKFKKQNTL
jgi:dCTP deaminase